MPYGTHKYGRIHKDKPAPLESSISSSLPTFICSKCKILKLQSTGYVDILLYKSSRPYRICTRCSLFLETWIK